MTVHLRLISLQMRHFEKHCPRIRKNMTVFLVSQRASSVMHADKILVLDDGRWWDTAIMKSCLERAVSIRKSVGLSFRKRRGFSMHKKKKSVWKKILWLIRPYLHFLMLSFVFAGISAFADIVCSDSDR